MNRPPQYAQTFLVTPDDSDALTVTIVFSEPISTYSFHSRQFKAQTRKRNLRLLATIESALSEYYQSEVQIIPR